MVRRSRAGVESIGIIVKEHYSVGKVLPMAYYTVS